MTKKKSTSKRQPQKSAPIPVSDRKPFGKTFILKDNTLTLVSEFPENAQFLPAPPLNKQDCSSLVFTNRIQLFGEKTIGLNVTSEASEYSWDAFLFDFSNEIKPQLYLLAVASGIAETMLTMITLNACIASKENRSRLPAQLAAIIGKDKQRKKIFDAYLPKTSTLASMLEQVVTKSLRGLCVTTVDDRDGIQLFNSYKEAHSDSLDVIYLHKYRVGKSHVLSMVPPFAELKVEAKQRPKERVIHTEADHLAKGSDLSRSIYEKLKADILKIDKSVVFNAKGKHYVSVKKGSGKNLAFFHFRKSGIYLVVMLEEKIVRKIIKKAELKILPGSVKLFWNGESVGLVISAMDEVKEITEVFKKLLKQ